MNPPLHHDSTLVERRRLQARLRSGLMVLLVVTGALILAVLFVGSARRVEGLCHSLLESTTNRTEVELARFFAPVDAGLRMAREWAAQGQLPPADTEAITARFVPLLESWPQVSSMMVAGTDGSESMLLRVGDTWTTRRVAGGSHGKGAVWRRWQVGAEPEGGTPETWTEDIAYDPRIRPWYAGAAELASDDAVHWTDPYTFFTTKDPGITASARTGPVGDAATRLLAFDVLLTDISAYTASLEVTTNGFVVVMTDDGRMLGLPRDPRFATVEGRQGSVLKPARELDLPVLARGRAAWADAGREPSGAYPFDVDGKTHWGSLRPFEVGEQRVAWIGVFVPEADLLGAARTEQALVIGILVLALIAAGVLAGLYGRKLREEVEAAVERARRLGQYTLVRKLGSGGMGTVYLARHAMLRRPTAIKLITGDDTDIVARFEREVQSTASLAHPHTIAIYDYGRTPQGAFYYAMEYLAGMDLSQLVQRFGPLPAGRAIVLLTQVCESLAEAHACGLIHRDIKPANVYVSRYGGTPDFAKVLDFGLVKRVSGDEDGWAEDISGTLATTIMGTPHYIAPEAITDPQSVDARSDLYSVGAMAYFLVTGTPVFEDKTAMGVLVQHKLEPPEPPSSRLAQRAQGGAVPEDFERLILECLAKSPADRPQSARELHARLQACAAAGSWTLEDADRWWTDYESDRVRAQSAAQADGAPLPETERVSATRLDVDLGSRRGGSSAH